MTTENLLYTDNDDNLWATDGTTTTEIAASFTGSNPIVVDDLAYFEMPDQQGDEELWSYNGSAVQQLTSSSEMVYTGTDSYDVAPTALGAYDDDVVFGQDATSDTSGDYTLALYDPKTQTVSQPTVPNGGYDPHDFVTLNNVLYFVGTDSTTNDEAIYSYNGSTVSELYNSDPTYSFKAGDDDFTVAAAGAVTGGLTVFNNHIYFGSGEETLYELGTGFNNATDALPAYAATLYAEPEYPYGGYPAEDAIVYNGSLFFDTAAGGVWSINTSNTVANPDPHDPGAPAQGAPFSPWVQSDGAQIVASEAVYNNTLYFTATNPSTFNVDLYSINSSGTLTDVKSDFEGSNFQVSGGNLYFYDGANDALGVYNGTTFSDVAGTAGNGGTPFLVVPFDATGFSGAPCYCRGTKLAAPAGDVRVEDLEIGDLVLTASGVAKPVKWIGHRRLDCARHTMPSEIWPVRVAAGAFGEGQPARDLWLSPGHCVAVDGVLIPIRFLANGRSIAQVETAAVEYWHVELDQHDILLAEGLPAESYLDCGNRNGFANGGAFIEAHPDFEPKDWRETCLPLVKQGPEVARAKARLHRPPVRRGL